MQTMSEKLAVAITEAVDAALAEVRRQGGPEYLLQEARNDGIAAGKRWTEMVLREHQTLVESTERDMTSNCECYHAPCRHDAHRFLMERDAATYATLRLLHRIQGIQEAFNPSSEERAKVHGEVEDEIIRLNHIGYRLGDPDE